MASPSSYYGGNFSPVPLTTFKFAEIDPFSFLKGDDYLKATPEDRGFMRQYQLDALQGRNAATLFKQKDFNIEGIKDFMKTQAEIAEGVASRKYNQELMGQGIGALAGGLKTLIGGGSPEMVAYLSQTPERGAAAYLEGYTSAGPRQNALPRNYGSSTRRSYFNT
jgi:hypothetical protein